MELVQEWERLIYEHEIDQKRRDLSDNRAVEAYLLELLPVERFLKQRYLEHYDGFFWKECDLDSEAWPFRRRKPNENIQISHHFRYDRHPMHMHTHFQLIYNVYGKAPVELENGSILLDEGDFCILAPKLRHRIVANSDDITLIKIYIRSTTFEQVFLRWLSYDNILSDFYRRVLYENETGSYLLFRTGKNPPMRELMFDMYREFMQEKPYSGIIVEGRLMEYFCRLVRDYSDSVIVSRDSGKVQNLGAIIHHIIEYHDQVTLDSLAQTAGYSKNHLCRLLKSGTGKTFTQILNAARIDAADKLLSTTDMRIHDIATHVGYTTLEHFYRVFREQRGMTPLEWRKKCGGG